MAGEEISAKELALKLLRHREFLVKNNGGISISGGEPLAQPDFLMVLLSELKGMHRIIDTSGYCDKKIFREVISRCDMVLFDLKHTDPVIHKKYTGEDNHCILENLKLLMDSDVPFYLRMPVIPGVNDTEEHFIKTRDLVKNAGNLQGVDILPYQHSAGAKYVQCGRIYKPEFDTGEKLHIPAGIFSNEKLRSRIL